jgi:hypothetical protein
MKKWIIFTLFVFTQLMAEAQYNGSAPGVPVFPTDTRTASNDFNYGRHANTRSGAHEGYSEISDGKRRDGRDFTIVGETRYFKNDAFQEGELRTRKGLFTNELRYRFDQFLGEIEVKIVESGKLMSLNEEAVLYCKIFFEGNTAVFMPVVLPDDAKPTLVQVVYKTPTLQVYRDVRKTDKRLYTSSKYVDDINNDYHYYVRKNDKSPVTQVTITAKSFINQLPNKRHTVQELFKAEEGKGKLTLPKLCAMMKKLDEKEAEN